LEFLLIILVAYLYCGKLLLNLDATKLQQTGEHNEISTLPLLAEIGLLRYGEFPLWNPYALTGYPYAAGDFFSFFWNPISTIPVTIWGGINGMKVSAFLCFVIAGLGQWMFGYVLGLRRTFRLWSAILFMISGGVALLWRVGWYGLLLGIVWFPWCYGLLLRALQKRTLPWVIATSLSVFMVLSSGGGYYPVYLFVSMAIITIFAIFHAERSERWRVVRFAALVILFSAALCAIVLIPYIDGIRYTTRNVPVDIYQYYSQPIQYGLLNYIIHTPDWFREDVLGTASGWNWFYIGWLPVAALMFVPLAYGRTRRQRWPMLVSGILFLILMMWFANKYSPFKLIYEWLPFLYNFRFPNRLLIVAASPLLTLSAQGLEYLYRMSKAGVIHNKINIGFSKIKSHQFPARHLVSLYWIIGLAMTTKTVFDVNKYFAFVDQDINAESFTVLEWLNRYDTSLYYVNLGDGDIYWDWTPAAYTFEMPVINFQLNHSLRSQNEQHSDGSPFFATEKYTILSVYKKPSHDNIRLIGKISKVNVYYNPDALPYAFSVQPPLVQGQDKLTPDQVTEMDARLLGPNRIVVKGEPAQQGDVLVVLMSDYPGWKLLIDGKPAPIAAVNGYLGSILQPGEHIYTFYFQPYQHLVGALVSNLTLAFITIYFAYLSVKKIGNEPVPLVA
jgi:hypothetical protein